MRAAGAYQARPSAHIQSFLTNDSSLMLWRMLCDVDVAVPDFHYIVDYLKLDLTRAEIGSPLYYAASLNLPELVEYYLKSGVDIYDDSEHSPLIGATRGGYIQVVKLLLDSEANIKEAEVNKAFNVAVAHGYTEIVQLLLERGYITNLELNGNTAFIVAVSKGNVKILRLLIEQGMDVRKCTLDKGPLYQAVSRGHQEAVQLLLDHGADVNPQGDITPLEEAIIKNEWSIARMLYERGAKFRDEGVMAAYLKQRFLNYLEGRSPIKPSAE